MKNIISEFIQYVGSLLKHWKWLITGLLLPSLELSKYIYNTFNIQELVGREFSFDLPNWINILSILLFFIFSGFLSWREQKIKHEKLEKEKLEIKTTTTHLTTSEHPTRCSEYVNHLYSNLIEKWEEGGVSGSGPFERPYAHVCYRELQKTATHLIITKSLRDRINQYLSYFECKGNLLWGVSGTCSIKTIWKTQKSVLAHKEKVREEAEQLAKDLHSITR